MPHGRQSLIPALFYLDPRAAFDWLQTAFGFEIDLLLEDEKGQVAHAELRYAESVIMVGPEWTAEHKSPASIGGKCTQTVHMHIEEDVDAHCERARAAGALILTEPETQFYGDRTYRAKDIEGHIWTIGQTVKATTSEDWERETGLKLTQGAGHSA
jgi:uncharacterized glyoxalase superfamily protein PhnB